MSGVRETILPNEPFENVNRNSLGPKRLPANQPPMDSLMFKKYGYQIIDWAVEYMTTLEKREPTTREKPGYLWDIVPHDPPQQGEQFESILSDLEKVAVHGMVHWQHRQFFAYFPAGNSWSSVLGDILSNATGANGQTWTSGPVLTELEIIVMDWCCKFLGLPKFFLSGYSEPGSEGQGVLQFSASESIFYSLIWARQDALKKLRCKYPDKTKADLLNMLVAYCNNECHCCVERGAMMGCVRMRKLKADNLGIVRSHVLGNAIREDMAKGLVPFFHCAIIGSTGVTSCDDLMEVGPVCKKFDMWLHVDAAYAGSSFVLPEMSHIKQGYEYVWSTNINTNKWMLCNFEASLHWVRYKNKAIDCFGGDQTVVRKFPNGVGPDLRHYGVAHSRRLRAVKLYFVVRNYGVDGIRRYIRNHINLAKLFEMYVRRDHRFEVVGGPFRFGLVTFRLKRYNFLTSRLLDALNASHKIHMVSSNFHNQVVIRFALCAEHANEKDIDQAWRTIDIFATKIMKQYEEDHGEDFVMRKSFIQQHIHDEMKALLDEPESDELDVEAEDVVNNLPKSQRDDEFVHEATATATDGNWGHGNDATFTAHDRYMHDHPEVNDDDKEYYSDEEELAHAAASMLHLTTLRKTLGKIETVRGLGLSGHVSTTDSLRVYEIPSQSSNDMRNK